MVLPLAHDSAESRRLPLVTLFILAACLLVQLWVAFTDGARQAAFDAAVRRASQLHDAHPELELPVLTTPEGRPLPPRVALRAIPRSRPEIEDEVERARQEALDGFVREAIEARASSPAYVHGYTPKEGRLPTLVTHVFMHGGWLHLLFNAWFLWLCGCNMEDRWGRGVYAVFYVVAGVLAALAHHALAGSGEVPLIGASGAVAGAMGAFLVVHARARIRFVALVFFRLFFFTAPAYVMLPLWVGSELVEALLHVSDNVAHFAHIGGFAFGLFFALVLRRTGIESKLDDAVERTVTVGQDPRLLEASALIDAKRAGEAIALLEQLAAQQPANIDVELERLRAARMAGDAQRESDAFGRLIDLYLRSDLPRTAADLYREIHELGRAHEIPARDRLFAADRLARKGSHEAAALAYAGLHEQGVLDETAVRALIGHGKMTALLGRPDEARTLLLAVRESPFSTAELDALADKELRHLEHVEQAPRA